MEWQRAIKAGGYAPRARARARGLTASSVLQQLLIRGAPEVQGSAQAQQIRRPRFHLRQTSRLLPAALHLLAAAPVVDARRLTRLNEAPSPAGPEAWIRLDGTTNYADVEETQSSQFL